MDICKKDKTGSKMKTIQNYRPFTKAMYLKPDVLREDKSPGYAGISFESAAININYFEIEKYAGRILCLKEVIRGMMQIQDKEV